MKGGISSKIMIGLITALLIFSVFFENSFKVPTLATRDLIPTVQEVSPGMVIPLNEHRDYRVFGQVNQDGTYNLFEFTRNPFTQHFAKEDFVFDIEVPVYRTTIKTLFYSMAYDVTLSGASLIMTVHAQQRENSQILSIVFLSISLALLIYISYNKKKRVN